MYQSPKSRRRRGTATIELTIGLPLVALFFATILSVGAATIAKSNASVRARHTAWAAREQVVSSPGLSQATSDEQPGSQLALANATQNTVTYNDTVTYNEVHQPVSLIDTYAETRQLSLQDTAQTVRSTRLKISEATRAPTSGLTGGSVSETAEVLPSMGWGTVQARSRVDVMGGVWDSREVVSADFTLDLGLPNLVQLILQEMGAGDLSQLQHLGALDALLLRALDDMLAQSPIDLLTAQDVLLTQQLVEELDKIFCDWLEDVANAIEAIEKALSRPLASITNVLGEVRKLINLLTKRPDWPDQIRLLSVKVRVNAPALDMADITGVFNGLNPAKLLELVSDPDKLFQHILGGDFPKVWSILGQLSCGGHLSRIKNGLQQLSPGSLQNSLRNDLRALSAEIDAIGNSL